jgi:hypothetical protein
MGSNGLSTRRRSGVFSVISICPVTEVTRADTYYYLGHRMVLLLTKIKYIHPLIGDRLPGFRRGCTAEQTGFFQTAVCDRPASGHFDHHTDTALRYFQSHFTELKADGIAGPRPSICFCAGRH